jgi:hypothetical protein
MPDPLPQPPSPLSLVDTLVGIFVKYGGPFASVGIMIAGVGICVRKDFGDGIITFGIGLALFSTDRRQKRTTDMIATTQAENKIENPHLSPKSADPAVQREIEKITASAPPPSAT